MRDKFGCRLLFAGALCMAVRFCGAAEASPVSGNLAEAPPNTWVRLATEATGARMRPVFYFEPALKKFVVSGGEAFKEAHADTEYFDPATNAWTNVYPPGAPYKTERGPTDTAGVDWRRNNVPLKTDKNGVMRVIRGVNPYEWDPGIYAQWAFNPDEGKCVAYLLNATVSFDGKTGEWMDLKVPAFAQAHTSFASYGSLAWDPVNKEYISIGGTSDEDGGTPGTWTLGHSAKEWKKLNPGSKELKDLNAEARALCAQVVALVNGCRNRFYLTESPAEAKRDLAAEAQAAAGAVEKFLARLKAAKLASLEANAPLAAAGALAPVVPGLQALAGKAGGKLVGETLASAQTLLDALEQAERALDIEPCGRGAATLVTCHGKDKLVLFGGCRFDGYLADTWIYDCKTRAWEQRHPRINPAPRAGHVMAWLPKSMKVVLYGGISFTGGYGVPKGNQPAPQDVWTYDLDANTWKLLAAPVKDAPTDAYGTVDANDLLVVVSRDPKNNRGRITWGMKIHPDAADAGSDQAGVAPGSAKVVFETPADFDKATTPDPDGVAKVLKELPANQWTLLPKPPKRINSHPWGTCPYDTLRQQYLSFGGGHSAAHFNDVAHYSMRTATWSVGYGEEYPYASASFSAFFNQTFRNRPTVPTHLWDCAAFDEPSGKAVFCVRGGTWVYDPDKREWEYPPVWQNGGGTKVNMTGTPKGVVYWDSNGTLQLFDVKSRAWSKLPVKGNLGAAYCDTGGMSYDSKRDCLWLGHGGGMTRYDFKTGEVSGDPVPGKPECVYMRATVYIPELDMVLSAGRQTGSDGSAGNLAYDIEGKKWVGLVLPCSDNQPRVNDKPYTDISLSLRYDPQLKLAILHSNQQEILAARLEKGSLKVFAPKLQEPKKK